MARSKRTGTGPVALAAAEGTPSGGAIVDELRREVEAANKGDKAAVARIRKSLALVDRQARRRETEKHECK